MDSITNKHEAYMDYLQQKLVQYKLEEQEPGTSRILISNLTYEDAVAIETALNDMSVAIYYCDLDDVYGIEYFCE